MSRPLIWRAWSTTRVASTPRRIARITASWPADHASRLRGRGLNFEEIRAYVPGDDLRHLDWKASLRVGRPLVRSYTEERDRPALFVVDQRISMFYGTRRAMKSVVAAEVAALAAWMSFQAGDRVGALLFDDSEIHSIRAHRSRTRVQAVLSALARAEPGLAANADAEGETSSTSLAAVPGAGRPRSSGVHRQRLRRCGRADAATGASTGHAQRRDRRAGVRSAGAEPANQRPDPDHRGRAAGGTGSGTRQVHEPLGMFAAACARTWPRCCGAARCRS